VADKEIQGPIVVSTASSHMLLQGYKLQVMEHNVYYQLWHYALQYHMAFPVDAYMLMSAP